MIEVREIIETILYDLNETYAREHSDEELISGINVILRYLNTALVNRESHLILKETKIKSNPSGVSLPKDFIKVATVDNDNMGHYKLMGSKIYTDSDSTVQYYYIIPKVETIDDTIDLPWFMFNCIVRLVEGTLNDKLENDAIARMVAKELEGILSTGEPIERPLQYYI